MSNVSLGGNHGNSIQFDGAVLQNEQEDEYRKEEELQQNELRALLTNAFDDLIDEDDILSITSDDGTDSRNVSLVRRHSNDSLCRVSADDRINEHPESDWSKFPQRPSQQGQRSGEGIPQPEYGQFEPLSRTQELPRGQHGKFNPLRASVESLPTYTSSRTSKGKFEKASAQQHRNHGSTSVRSSQDLLDSDYHSTGEETHHQQQQQKHQQQRKQQQQTGNCQGNVNPLPSNHEQGQNIQRQTSLNDMHSHMSSAERENILRKSIEDFEKFKDAYKSQQGQGHADEGHMVCRSHEGHLVHEGHQGHFFGNGDYGPHQPHYHVAEQPYDQHYYMSHDHQTQGHPVHHEGYGYEGHFHDNGSHVDPHGGHMDTHHHFRNIYADRPYHMIGEREETEGGNIGTNLADDMHFYHHGYQQVPSQQQQGNHDNYLVTTQDTGYFSHRPDKTTASSAPTPGNSKNSNTVSTSVSQNTNINNNNNPCNISIGSGRKLPQVTYRFQNVNNSDSQKEHSRTKSTSSERNSDRGSDRNSDRGSERNSMRSSSDKSVSSKGDREKVSRDGGGRSKKEATDDPSLDKDFIEQGGENAQLAQLQILYKARGRKVEELRNELEVVKAESGREIRILKHQLSVAKGESEGSCRSLESVQSLLQEAQSDNAQLMGRVNACESQIEGLLQTKDDLIKKLQTSESTIETLHKHLDDLGSSDSLTRARHDHDIVVSGLQKKHETEVKNLQGTIDHLTHSLEDKGREVSSLQQKLEESVKAGESAHISRAETINRLTQSLEESQKRCRNLLEASSSQEMSQARIQLQQAVAAKSISDEMCSSLQEEIQDLKEQVQMLESASSLGVTMATGGVPTSGSTTSSVFMDQNDSMADLGIKKTLDFDTPQGTPVNALRSHTMMQGGSEVVTSLKCELERCLVSNKQKRTEVNDLKDEMRKVKKDMLDYKQRCDRAELMNHEQKKRISDLESCLSPSDKTSAIENRAKKDIENLKREKKILLEDIEELQKRLEEISTSEEKLTQLNRELSKQIADMVTEYDQDKRQAIERAHRASEQVLETSRSNLRAELEAQFDMERASIVSKYEKDCTNLRAELAGVQGEVDRVKAEYCRMSEDTEHMKEAINQQWQQRLEAEIEQVKNSLQKEAELALLRAEEEWQKVKELELEKLKSELRAEQSELVEKITSELGEEKRTALDQVREENATALRNLKTEHEKEVKKEHEKFESELKAMRDILELEKVNDLEKLDKEKINEIEKLKKLVIDKELFIKEKEQHYKENETLLGAKRQVVEKLKVDCGEKDKIIEGLKQEYKSNFDMFREEINEKTAQIEELTSKLEDQKSTVERLEAEVASLEELRTELSDKDCKLEQLKNENRNSQGLEMSRKVKEVEELQGELESVRNELESVRGENQALIGASDQVKRLRNELEEVRSEKLKLCEDATERNLEIRKLRDELETLERLEREKDSELDRLRKDESEKDEIENLRKELEKNTKKERQTEIEGLRKEVICLKLELERAEREKVGEVEKVARMKQAEIDSLDRKRRAELDKLRRERQEEVERLTQEAELARRAGRGEEGKRATKGDEDLSAKVRDRLNKTLDKTTEDDLNRTIETKVAMSKVVWLEEHRATRQAAIDNAVRLAEAELRVKMEADLESRVEARLEEAKIIWQNERYLQLQAERDAWEKDTQAVLARALEREREKWRRTELSERLEMELETERLRAASQLETTLAAERDDWERNVLEPLRQQWHSDLQQTLKLEKENWRCLELETEKLTLLREYESRLALEKQSWVNKTLPEALAKEKSIWKTESEQQLRKVRENWQNSELPKELEQVKVKCQHDFSEQLKSEEERWRTVDLPRQLDQAREKWYEEIEGRLREERNNWRNCDLPEEIEKERRKWMKLMEQTLSKERDNWKTRDLPAELSKLKQGLETEMVSKLEQEKDKLQKESEAKVLEAIEEHQEACKEELYVTIAREKDLMQQKLDSELQERFQKEKKIWREMVDAELAEKLDIEREKWKRKSEADWAKKLETEKQKFETKWKTMEAEKTRMETDWIKTVETEKELVRSSITADTEEKFKAQIEVEKHAMRERLEEEFDAQMKVEIDRLRASFEREAREDFEHLKLKFERETQEEYERLKAEVDEDAQMNLAKERELLQLQTEREMNRKIDDKEEKWKSEFEKELTERLLNEEQKWKEMIEKDIEDRLQCEKEVWMKGQEEEVASRVKKTKEELRTELEQGRAEEVQRVSEAVETKLRLQHEEEMEKLRVDVEQEFHLRVEHEVSLAVEEAREDWNREYLMERSISTTSAEASQGLLREEIESLKCQLEKVQAELLDKEQSWRKEKEDIILQKDLERRQSLDRLQEQSETEYKQFIEEHKDTLDKALKSAREQHNKDKEELEERFTTQMKLLQAREKSLHDQLQAALHGSQDRHDDLAGLERERVLWFEERERLLQDISDRESLLGKADVHLSKEVDKLRSELQAAYQRRLEGEITMWRQKLEAEYSRANNSEQKEKLQLEKQLSEMTSEVNKVKGQLKEDRGKHSEEVKVLTARHSELEKKLHDHSRLEGELRKAKELLKGYKDELTSHQQKVEAHKQEKEELTTRLSKAVQTQERLQAELQKLKEERSDSMQTMETSYRKDISTYKQRLDEATTRISKMEKHLQDMKYKYRTELESLRKALEGENDIAMNAMKTKMIELQKKHVSITDELKRKQALERDQWTKLGQTAVARGTTPTANTAEVEEIDKTVKELRSQYLDTVAKIKGDVLKHITETNVRAAETVKHEMDRERMTTFQQIKDFYRQNVKTILETELVGATLEKKLLAVEEALEGLSSNPSSRSATPKSDEFILDERQLKSQSRSGSRDAGISPKGQRSVSFTSATKGERSHTPVLHSGKDMNVSSGGGSFVDDSRSPKSRMFTKSPRDMNVTLRSDRDWKYDSFRDGTSFDTRRPENRPTSAKSMRELRELDQEAREQDSRPLSAKSCRDLHVSLRQKHAGGEYESRALEKRRSRTLISTRDIHAGRYREDEREGAAECHDASFGYTGDQRAKSTTPMYSSMSRSSPSLYRPVSVPDLSSEEKELKLWTENNNDSYRYTPLRETLLRTTTNLHRSNSKSESDLSIAEKNFTPMKSEFDSNLDLSTGSLTSDAFMSPRKSRDAGETPTSTPRRHVHRKHYTLHSFPTRDQISSELRKRDSQAVNTTTSHNGPNTNSDNRSNANSFRLNLSHSGTAPRNDEAPTNSVTSGSQNSTNSPMNSPISGRTSRNKNLPLIQFRHGKLQSGLSRGLPGTSSKSPHPDEEGVIVRDTPPTRDQSGTPDRVYRPLSVSSNAQMNF